MSDKEIWKDIEGYEGYYQVSNFGNVKSLDRVIEHLRFGFCQRKGGLRRLSTDSDGYHRVGLYKDGKGKHFFVHRLVAQAFIPNPESKPEVNHINAVKTDNNVSNLEWVTNIENITHAIDAGTHNNRGERHGKSKLKESDVLEIRHRYSKGNVTKSELAIEYSVNRRIIYGIVKGLSWKHI